MPSRRDHRLLVSFYVDRLDPAAQKRLWDDIVQFAIDALGVGSVSLQPEMLREGAPPAALQAREGLLNSMRFEIPRRSVLGLRPPRWPLARMPRGWIAEAGPWVFRLTLWKGDAWILESSDCGRHFRLALEPEEWDRLRGGRASVSSLDPPPHAEPLRKIRLTERRGWRLLRAARWVVAALGGLAVAVFQILDGAADEAWYGLPVAAFLAKSIPTREPGPFDRLVARTQFPTDARFERRLQRLTGIETLGIVVVAGALPSAIILELTPGWRLALWILAAVGAALTLSGVTLLTRLLIKYRVKKSAL